MFPRQSVPADRQRGKGPCRNGRQSLVLGNAAEKRIDDLPGASRRAARARRGGGRAGEDGAPRERAQEVGHRAQAVGDFCQPTDEERSVRRTGGLQPSREAWQFAEYLVNQRICPPQDITNNNGAGRNRRSGARVNRLSRRPSRGKCLGIEPKMPRLFFRCAKRLLSP